MKKILLFMILIILVSSIAFSQNAKDASSDELKKIKEEIDALRRDVDEIKQKTDWFSFRIAGSSKTIYGLNVWQRFVRGKGDPVRRGFMNPVINHGFDFENSLLLYVDLGNKVLANSSNKYKNGTEILIDLYIKSNGVSNMKPRGSWYVVEGEDDQGNTTDIYFPRYESGGSNVFFGNFEIAIREASVKNIIGTGVFVSYKDVLEVQQYYGASGLVDILKLNHEFFNNGFYRVKESGSDEMFGELYYSFDADDYDDYDPESQISEAMKLWSNSALHNDPSNSDYNQKPHGMSFGVDKKLADGFNLYLEGGIASKDAFDPKYYEDSNMDYGFFLKFEPKFFNKKLIIHPKIAFSYAFQSQETTDNRWEWSTFAMGLSIPIELKLPTGNNDKLKFEFSWDMNTYIVDMKFATLLSLNLELVILNEKLYFKLPVIYSYKTPWSNGFQRMGHEDVKWIDQLYDDHIINLSFVIGFDSKQLFGDVFEMKMENSVYFAYLRQWYREYTGYSPNTGEVYLYDIFRNEFILNNLGIEKITLYYEFGYGYSSWAKMVFPDSSMKYEYDRDRDIWIDTDSGEEMKWTRWWDNWVFYIETGINVDIVKNLNIGFSVQSPKILIGEIVQVYDGRSIGNPIGDQRSYVLFKLWTEIKF